MRFMLKFLGVIYLVIQCIYYMLVRDILFLNNYNYLKMLLIQNNLLRFKYKIYFYFIYYKDKVYEINRFNLFFFSSYKVKLRIDLYYIRYYII